MHHSRWVCEIFLKIVTRDQCVSLRMYLTNPTHASKKYARNCENILVISF